MRQSTIKRLEYRNHTSMIVITLLVALIALTVSTGGFVFPGSRAQTLAPQTPAPESKQTDVRELKLGAPVERTLAGGEVHSYRVMLTAGQYLYVVVEQKGIDVVVKLFGPDGQKITEVDSPNGTQGPEPVSLITPAPGNYRVEVVSPDKAVASGGYEIKVAELRESTPKDLDRIEAERALAAAEQFRGQGTAESLRKAIESYNKALPLLRTVMDRQNEVTTLTSIGVVYSQLGENQKALEYYNQALPLRKAMADRRGEAQLLNNIGMVYWQLGDSRKALEYYSQALPLRRATGDRQGEAITLNLTGLANNNLGKLNEALAYYNQALVLQRALDDRRNEAITLVNIGATYTGFGELQKALEYYNQVLSLVGVIGDRRIESATLNNIGVIYWQLGENQKALEYHNRALPLRRATGDRPGEFSSIANIGQAYLSLGEPQKALEYYDQALAIAHAVGDRRSEAITLYNIGTVYRRLGEPRKVLDFLNQSLLLRRAVGDRLGEALTLSQLGSTYSSLGEPEKGLSHLQQALELHRVVGDRGGEAGTLQSIAQVYLDQGRLIEARTHTEAGLEIIESTRSKFVSHQLRTSFSASRQGYYEFYIDLLMRLHRSQPLAGYDATALQASERARARSLLEILTEARADIRQGVDPVLLERERSSQQQLNAKSERLTRLLSGKPSEEQATAARKEVETLLANYHELEAQIRAKSPRYAALTQPQPLSLKEIQQVLDKDTLLLEYAVGEERSYLWAVTQTSVTSFELPKRADIEATARQAYEAVTARNRLVRFEKQETRQARIARADAEYFTAAARLSEMLLNPAVGKLGRKRLLIVSDAALQYVPFGALPIPGGQLLASKNNQARQTSNYRPLITEHEIVSLPSASALAVLRRELVGRQRGARTVAVLADPVFQDDDPRVRRDPAKTVKQANEPSSKAIETRGLETEMERSARDVGEVEFRRLPFSRREAEAIAAITPRAMRRESLDFEANRATATSADLSDYRIIHFATHAFLNSRHPELSGIVLSLVDEAGRPQDGFLRLHDVYNLKLGADLVVLSACRTALGKEIKGEGLVGLTRGFMYAGAPRIVASLWAVDDATTAELMKRFYREMLLKKQRPAAALRTAQVSLWREQSLPPYYWAAFVLQGEWK